VIASFTRGYTFSSSHRLHTESLSDEENRAAFGKCNNPYGHGHNYRLFVTITGPISPETGMVINMATLDAVVREHILSRFDHRNLNLDPLFTNHVSTTENLTIAAFQILQPALHPAHLASVRIEETENNFFEYSGAASPAPQTLGL
jgi:6-pyruvoyltetrahydropterin/6-carboxytetrahydropterin synthase